MSTRDNADDISAQTTLTVLDPHEDSAAGMEYSTDEEKMGLMEAADKVARIIRSML